MSYYGLSTGMVLRSIPGDFAQPNIFSPADENSSWWGVPDIEHQKTLLCQEIIPNGIIVV